MRITLVILGVLVVAAVWAYNKFQERRMRRSFDTPLMRARPDVLLDRDEPAMHHGEGRSEPTFSHSADGQSEEPAQVEINEADDEAIGGLAQDGESGELDTEINAVIALIVEQPISGERALANLQGFRRAGRQSVALWGTQNGQWSIVRAGERFDALAVTVQLANRSGALNEIEYSELVTSIQHAAESIPAACEIPDMTETVARARALDSRCAALDAQLGITLAVVADRHWSGNEVDTAVRSLGMLLRPDGRYHFLSDNGLSLFCLQGGDGTAFRADVIDRQVFDRLTLVLDVPTVPQALQPYARMTTLARDLAGQLGAVLVDDQSRSLNAAMLAGIELQLVPVYHRLEAEGMPAGSRRARVLFR